MKLGFPNLGSSGAVLLVLAVEVFIIMLGLGLANPILPLYAQSFGVGAAAVGSLVTVFGVARIFVNIPAGHWTERFGRRRLLVLGPLVTATGSFGFALADSFVQLLVWRVLQGFGSAVVTTASMVMLADLSTRENRGRIMSLYQGSLLLGAGAGPAVGGLVAAAWGYHAPFLVFGVLMLVASGWAALRLPETRDRARRLAEIDARQRESAGEVPGSVPAQRGESNVSGDLHLARDTQQVVRRPGPSGGRDPLGSPASAPASMITAVRALLGERNFLLVSAMTLMTFFTRSGGQMTLLPLVGDNRFGLSEAAIGGVFTLIAVMNFLTLYAAGSLSDRFGRKTVIVPSGVLVATAIALFAFAGGTTSFVLFAMLLGVGTGLGGPAPAAYAADIVPPRFIGPGMGLYRTIGDLGFVLGPVALGALVDVWGYEVAFLVNGALMLAATLVFAVWARETAGTRAGR